MKRALMMRNTTVIASLTSELSRKLPAVSAHSCNTFERIDMPAPVFSFVLLSKQTKSATGPGWMRVDKTAEDTTRVLAFDNMHDRPVNGTTGWRDCQVVLDVPADASNIYFGVILGGSGQVSISDISIESVDQDVPVTAAKPVSYFRSHDKLRDFRRPLETPFNLEFQP
jgi:hypothetical protein